MPSHTHREDMKTLRRHKRALHTTGKSGKLQAKFRTLKGGYLPESGNIGENDITNIGRLKEEDIPVEEPTQSNPINKRTKKWNLGKLEKLGKLMKGILPSHKVKNVNQTAEELGKTQLIKDLSDVHDFLSMPDNHNLQRIKNKQPMCQQLLFNKDKIKNSGYIYANPLIELCEKINNNEYEVQITPIKSRSLPKSMSPRMSPRRSGSFKETVEQSLKTTPPLPDRAYQAATPGVVEKLLRIYDILELDIKVTDSECRKFEDMNDCEAVFNDLLTIIDKLSQDNLLDQTEKIRLENIIILYDDVLASLIKKLRTGKIIIMQDKELQQSANNFIVKFGTKKSSINTSKVTTPKAKEEYIAQDFQYFVPTDVPTEEEIQVMKIVLEKYDKFINKRRLARATPQP